MTIVRPDSYKIYAWISAAWVDITTDVVTDDITAEWGMMGNEPTDRIAVTGEMTFTLKDIDGEYIPGISGALAGWERGVQIKLVVTYDSVVRTWQGRVSGIDPVEAKVTNEKRVKVTVLDWMEQAVNYPLVGVGTDTTKRADEAIQTIVTAMPIAPAATSLDVGINTFTSVFDTVGKNTRAYSEFAKLVMSELGMLYIKKDVTNGETLVFEANDYRNGLRTLKKISRGSADSGFLLNEDDSFILQESGDQIILDETFEAIVDNSMMTISTGYGKNIKNRVPVTAHPKYIDTTIQTLFSLENPIRLGAGETKTFRGIYTDSIGGQRISAISSSMLPPTNDPNYVRTSLLHFDTTEWIDESGKIWTPHGGITMGTGNWGGDIQFDKVDNYLTSPSHEDFEFGSGDFTVEWWEYRIDISGETVTIARDATSIYPPWQLAYQQTFGGNYLRCYFTKTGGSWDLVNGLSLGIKAYPPSGPWTHLAVVRSGNNFYGFKNGILQDTIVASGAIVSCDNPISLGKHTSYYLYADIDELRITKGLARYTAVGFTPQTSPFTLSESDNTDPTEDYRMNTAIDDSGTDITANLTILVTYGAEGPIYTLTNTSSYLGYVTRLQARGYGVYAYNPIEVSEESAASIAAYGYQNQAIDQQYQQDISAGDLEAKKIIDLEKSPRLVLESISMNANRSVESMMMFLNVDVGDLISIIEDKYGIDGYYYVQGISSKIGLGGVIDYTWILKEYYSLLKGLTMISVEFSAVEADDGINFGYLPQISDLAARSISIWIYIHDAGTDFKNFVCGTMSDGSGNRIHLSKDGVSGHVYLLFYTNLFNVAPGWWYQDTYIPINEWHHVIVTYAPQDTAADPVIYVDGEVIAITETDTPSGTLNSEYGANYVIGNIKTTTWDYLYPFDGLIKDNRIYNRILSAAEAATIYTDGAGAPTVTDGLVFQACCVRTSELTAFTDKTLGTEDTLIDNVFGCIGTPHGAPITRVI